MTLRQSHDPYGFKKLLVYTKADQLQDACAKFTATFPREKTLIALADQMDRSARSVKQNIVEGWKRNGTREYYDFLGFSIGANAELEEDCDDIIKGRYKGIEWEKGEKWSLVDVERLPFYPLNSHLPLLIQLKLRCKELNMLLSKLQISLAEKLSSEHRLSLADNLQRTRTTEQDKDDWYEKALKEHGLMRLSDGRVVKKGGDS